MQEASRRKLKAASVLVIYSVPESLLVACCVQDGSDIERKRGVLYWSKGSDRATLIRSFWSNPGHHSRKRKGVIVNMATKPEAAAMPVPDWVKSRVDDWMKASGG